MKQYLLGLLFLGIACWAQKPAVQTQIDTTKNKVGAQFVLSLKATVDTSKLVVFPTGKNFGQLEVIRSYPIDTIKNGVVQQLIKRYGLTQFDSGRYTIPRLPIKIGSATAFSDSLIVEIQNVQVDTLKQKLYDIKDIIPTHSGPPYWLFILIVALVLVGYFMYKFFTKKQPSEKQPLKEIKTPIERATSLLQQLEKKELVRQGQVKTYYSELTDIARSYIEEVIAIPAMESTTAELIEKLKLAAAKKNIPLQAETITNLEKVLRQADLVKFAKERPQDFEIANDRQKIETAIVTINNAIPAEPEVNLEHELNEQLKQQRQKERRQARLKKIVIFSAIGLSTMLLLLSILSYLGYVQVFNSRNHSLLKGDWIQSEYGNPSVLVETPAVLIRQDPKKLLSPNAIAILKEFQMFGYGSPLDDLYILVSTFKYKQQDDLKLETILEGNLKELESKGASNILVKTDSFSTKSGITGIRAFGTLSVVDGVLKRSNKVYYEMLLFKQEQGLQQVLVWHPEGDKSGEQILARIIQSVELQVGAQ